MSTTPPPRSPAMNPPPAPRFGAFEDKWEPFTPRLTRASAKRQRAQTPTQDDPFSSTNAQPASPPPSTRKQHGRSELHGREAAAPTMRNAGLAAPVLVNGMLPTPTKTPKKRRNVDTSASRMLFSSPTPAEATPSRKRRGFKFGELDGPSTETEQEQVFDIFTDSRDRVPEVDVTPENPFLGPGSRDPDSADAIQALERPKGEERDGIYVTFRGKKMFRPFEHRETSPTPGATESANVDANEQETIVSYTPRILFPTRKQKAAIELREASQSVDYVGEEDLTDIDESNLEGVPSDGDLEIFSPEVPTATLSNEPPATPPSDLSEHAAQPNTPELTPSVAGKASAPRKSYTPFDDWKVTKPGVGIPAKRKQDEVTAETSGGRTLKRAKSSIH